MSVRVTPVSKLAKKKQRDQVKKPD